MVNSVYLNTTNVRRSFSSGSSSLAVKQNIAVNNNISFLKINPEQKSYKKTMSHNDLAKFIKGFQIQKRSAFFKRPKFIKTNAGEYALIRSVIV